MGLFDKFRKKVRDAASEVDTDSLSAEEGSDEAIEALSHQEKLAKSESQQKENSSHKTQPDFGEEEEEWEDFDDEDDLSLPSNSDDEGKLEDVHVFMYEDIVYIRQWVEEEKRFHVIQMSPLMLEEFRQSFKLPDGAYIVDTGQQS